MILGTPWSPQLCLTAFFTMRPSSRSRGRAIDFASMPISCRKTSGRKVSSNRRRSRQLSNVAAGRPNRLMKRLGMPVSDDTILRQLKKHVAAQGPPMSVRVAGVDDWSWRKGCTYGTIVVDLERREVVDVLPDRSAAETAEWFSQHPEVEIISRDRCGLYARGAREGAPQARQVADRFHLLQNLRETIETQLSRTDRPTGRALLPASKDEDDSGVTIACRGRAPPRAFLILFESRGIPESVSI
jgi:transposase